MRGRNIMKNRLAELVLKGTHTAGVKIRRKPCALLVATNEECHGYTRNRESMSHRLLDKDGGGTARKAVYRNRQGAVLSIRGADRIHRRKELSVMADQ